MYERMIIYADTPQPNTAHIARTWTLLPGTGRLARLRGEGTVEEIFRFAKEPRSVAGTLAGDVRLVG